MQRIRKSKNNIQSLFLGIFSGLIVLSIILISIFYRTNKTKNVELNGYTITAYCPGYCCNKSWAGHVVDGSTMDYYINKGENIIAADIFLLPLGTTIIWNNTEYVVRDIGSNIKGKRLDILLKTHKDTIDFGIKSNQSIIIKDKENN